MKTKIIITLTLIMALFFAPLQRTRASAVAGVCLIIIAAIGVGGVGIVVRSCQPKYFCLCDPGEQPPKYWVGRATKHEVVANDWIVMSGPYASVAEANGKCPPPPNSKPAAAAALREMPVEIQLQKSTNLVNWVTVATTLDDPTNFSFSMTNSIEESVVYYRACIANP